MPEIAIRLVASDHPAEGVGEAALPLIAPCIADALFAPTGTRFRALPFSVDRLLAPRAA